MKLEHLNVNGEKTKDINIDNLFGEKANDVVLKDAIVLARASLRQGTHKTKTRDEVAGGGRKPWKQKGTGRARQGSIRAVQWVGGGIAFGPVPRDYNKKQNKKERRLALKSAYFYKAEAGNLIIIDQIKFDNPKTKNMLNFLKNIKVQNDKVLLVVKEYDENILLAARNIGNIIVTVLDEVSVLDITSAKKILMEEAAFENLKEALK